MIHWNLGGAFLNFDTMAKLANIVGFYRPEGHQLSVFDAPFMCTWEGGRPGAPSMSVDDELSDVIRGYNQRHIGFNFVYSNSLLQPEHLSDPRCNGFLERHQHPLNGVIVSSELLARHVRKHFPSYRLIYSLTHGKSQTADLDFYRRAQDLYDLVVLVPDLNDDLEFIQKLDPSRLEILVNESCLGGCRFRAMHYKTIDWYNLHRDMSVERDVHSFCVIHNQAFFEMRDTDLTRLRGLRLTFPKVQTLMDMGVKHFKFSGRRIGSQHAQFKADISQLMFPAMGIDEIAWRIEDSGRFGGQQAPRNPKRILDLIRKVRQEAAV